MHLSPEDGPVAESVAGLSLGSHQTGKRRMDLRAMAVLAISVSAKTTKLAYRKVTGPSPSLFEGGMHRTSRSSHSKALLPGWSPLTEWMGQSVGRPQAMWGGEGGECQRPALKKGEDRKVTSTANKSGLQGTPPPTEAGERGTSRQKKVSSGCRRENCRASRRGKDIRVCACSPKEDP